VWINQIGRPAPGATHCQRQTGVHVEPATPARDEDPLGGLQTGEQNRGSHLHLRGRWYAQDGCGPGPVGFIMDSVMTSEWKGVHALAR